VTVRNLTGFAGACQEALIAALDAIATVGEERRGHLKDAKLAVDRPYMSPIAPRNGISPTKCAGESRRWRPAAGMLPRVAPKG
jgi:hypothetical protein